MSSRYECKKCGYKSPEKTRQQDHRETFTTCPKCGWEYKRCFIATAAYGSEIAPQVNFLRAVREQELKTTLAGALLVQAFEWVYYQFSPQVARKPLVDRAGTVFFPGFATDIDVMARRRAS